MARPWVPLPVLAVLFVFHQTATAATLVTTINVCGSGQAAASNSVNPKANIIYTFGQGSGTIINGADNTVLACVPLPGTFHSVDVNPNTDRYYVANQQGGRVTVGRGTSPDVIATISVPGFPTDVAVNPATNRIYVTSQGFGGNDRVFVIDGGTNTVINLPNGIQTGGVAGPVVLNPLTNRVYVGTSNGIVVIDGVALTVLTTIPGFLFGGGAKVNLVTNRLYARRDSDGAIAVIDGWTNAVIDLLTLFTTSTFALPVGIHAALNRIYIGTDTDEFLIVDGVTDTQIASLAVPSPRGRAAVHPVTNLAYVASPPAPGADEVLAVIQDAGCF